MGRDVDAPPPHCSGREAGPGGDCFTKTGISGSCSARSTEITIEGWGGWEGSEG